MDGLKQASCAHSSELEAHFAAVVENLDLSLSQSQHLHLAAWLGYGNSAPLCRPYCSHCIRHATSVWHQTESVSYDSVHVDNPSKHRSLANTMQNTLQ